MKEKPVKNKLFLNKETVSCLNEREMKNFKGGTSINIQIVDTAFLSDGVELQQTTLKPELIPWGFVTIQISN